MTKQELVDFVTKELVVMEGGWQSAEMQFNKATHSAQYLVERLLEAGHVKVDESAK